MSMYKEYCTGCGLCHSVNNVNFEQDEKGFLYPVLEDKDETLCSKVCPASGTTSYTFKGSIWGNIDKYYVGYSNEADIRKNASSGGVLTTLCIYLLEHHIVDGIIQTRKNVSQPYKTETVVSRKREDVLSCMGSRYAISEPLYNIKELLNTAEKYVFVGKPCDVVALRNYAKIDQDISTSIKYYFSFFCAGEPSEVAQERLVKILGCSSLEDCKDLNYRGHGWPGFATAESMSGEKKQITYDESWGQILGRDIRKACRTCIDGTGDAADIACGDAWYMTQEGKPDFSEHDGRNIIFARNKVGADLLERTIMEGYIVVEEDPIPFSDLEKIQNYQYTRKANMSSMLKGYRFCRLPVPDYKKEILNSYSKHSDIKTRMRRFAGTIKRHIQGKI